MAAVYGLSALWTKTAYLSYLLVYVLGGSEAANTMGLKDFLVKRSLSPSEMITAAADGEYTIVVRALTQIKDRVKVDALDYGGSTAFMCAIASSCSNLTDDELRDWSRSQRRQILVEFLRGRLSTPQNPKTIAAIRNRKYNRILELLLLKGADINFHRIGNVDEDVTPLHIATMENDVSRIKWLLAKGARINDATENKMTSLHFAAKLGKCDAATYLLMQDASSVAKTDIGWTPLHFAAHTGGTTMVKLLLKAGADKSLEDDKGRTPVDIAAIYGNRSSFDVLRKWTEEKYSVKENLAFLASKM